MMPFLMPSLPRTWILVLVILAAVVPPFTLGAQTRAADARALDARLATLRQEAATLAGEQKTLLGRLRQLHVARETRIVELEQTNASLARVAADAAAASGRVDAIEGELRAIAPEIRERLVRTYKLLPLGYDRLMLSLDEARSIDRAARIVGVVARRDRARLEHFQQLREQRRAEAERLQAERATLERLQSRLRAEEAALAEASVAQASLLDAVRERRDVNQQLVEELTEARERLDRSIAALKPDAASGYTSRPGGGAGLGLAAGTMDWPAPGRIVARFGRETSSRFGTAIVRNGVEIDAALGTEVRAVQAGRVAFADTFLGFGRVVIVDHGSKAYTLYGHLSTIGVARDDRIERGRVVGTVGAAPAGAASLYFEVRVDGRPVDPVQWLKR
jgi:septal ring factor EnvC (AmiA/AmiB activator)